MTALKKLSPRAHWEACLAIDAALNYCTKGEIIIDTNESVQGRRSDLEYGITAMKSGGLDQVAEEHPMVFVKYHKGLEALRQRLVKTKKRYEVEIIYLWSEQKGTGKSHMAREIDEDLYNVPEPNQNGGALWFDGYEGEETILLDDFYGWIKYSTLLQITDIYPMRVAVKTSFAKREWTRVIITSNLPPEELYPNIEDTGAFLRRISKTVHLTNEPYVKRGPIKCLL